MLTFHRDLRDLAGKGGERSLVDERRRKTTGRARPFSVEHRPAGAFSYTMFSFIKVQGPRQCQAEVAATSLRVRDERRPEAYDSRRQARQAGWAEWHIAT